MLDILARAVLLERDYWNAQKNIRKHQDNALHFLVKGMTETALGRSLGIRPGMDLRAFRRTVPVAEYGTYAPWIKRICAGERDVLWPGRPVAFVTTSGTTSEEKLIPITREFLAAYHKGNTLTFERGARQRPSVVFGRTLTIGGPRVERVIGDIPTGSITGLLFATLPSILASRLAVPADVLDVPAPEEKLYLTLRMAIEQRVSAVIAVVPGSFIVLADALADQGESLAAEVEHGTLRPLESCPGHVQRLLRRRLRPNPQRARELRRIMKEDGKLFPRRVWPVRGICTYLKAGYDTQWRAIDDLYGYPVRMDPGLVASEGRVSTGIRIGTVASACYAPSTFLEFQPVEITTMALAGDILLPDEVAVGETYCPIISSPNGFLRYRLGDVIRVVGRLDSIPLIEYLGRVDHSLSVAGEKMTELHIQGAIQGLVDSGAFSGGAWAVAVDRSTVRPRYVVHLEGPRVTFGGDEALLDTLLQRANVSYRRKREQELLAPATIEWISNRSFAKGLKGHQWLGQMKPQRLFSEKEELLATLDA